MLNLRRTLRRTIGRPFTDPTLEHEFIGTFRAVGASFVAIATALAGLGVFAFALIELANGKGLDNPQPLRLVLTVALFGAAYFARRKTPLLLKHYAFFGSTVIVISASAAYFIAFRSRPAQGGPMLYWTLTSGSVLATIIVYGFMRLQSANTLALGAFNLVAATAFAKPWPKWASPHIPVPDRSCICVRRTSHAPPLYRLVVGRERKLFLQAKRKARTSPSCGAPSRSRGGGNRAGRGGQSGKVVVPGEHEP